MIIKILPVLVAVVLSLVNFEIFSSDKPAPPSESIEDKNPRNHLTQDADHRSEVTAKVLSVSEASSKNLTINHTDEKISAKTAETEPVETEPEGEKILRLTWDIIPDAVKYKIAYEDKTAVSYTHGVEIPVQSVNSEIHVTALSFSNNILANEVKIRSSETNPAAPLTTTEFDKMSSPPVYLVYSWIPTNSADHYEIQLLRDGEILRDYLTDYHPKDDNFDFYDKIPVLEVGEYYWRVRGLSADDEILTDWSEQAPNNTFTVKSPETFCAIGDSITHGGGSISVPPSTVVYNWENYCAVPVKNLGKSGDTTEKLLDRFEEDVLPFNPEILFIMAGVNDYRGDILGWDSVMNLAALKEKCEDYGIKPVFITPTPLNPELIRKVKFINAPPYDWQEHRKYICDWVRRQEYCIDLTDTFSDGDGNLKSDLSIDGLHPDAEGKKIIGQAVETWLKNYLEEN